MIDCATFGADVMVLCAGKGCDIAIAVRDLHLSRLLDARMTVCNVVGMLRLCSGGVAVATNIQGCSLVAVFVVAAMLLLFLGVFAV